MASDTDALQSCEIVCRRMLVLVYDGDMLSAGLLQQLVHAVFRKPRVARFDCEEKSVIGHAAEAFPVEHRMVPARQTIHDLPCKERRKCSEKHRQLEHDREKSRHSHEIPWFAVHVEPIENRRRAKFNYYRGEQTRNSAKQNPAAQPRFA